MESCVGCGAELMAMEGPTHPFMRSSAACWNLFGIFMAKEYSEPAYRESSALAVDCYAVQHPGPDNRRANQWMATRLMSLCLVLEYSFEQNQASAAVSEMIRQFHPVFDRLQPPADRGHVTIQNVAVAQTPVAQRQWVQQWAESCWQAWRPHADQVRHWLREYKLVRA
ncbi:DUF5946 family protein [Pleionea sp. CnH1-48]|uniref:DUF5946 family protein n=1 Tax=Pleionea sp. CnH1-48 TaxID=2954494 RepID=UPI0020984DFA|nr:DUF5946 family protein [Pleionea sp. CnH1-48]MCO7226064.1 DUF5946 family protein [Pleionea sp. CnH1-48]